MGSRGASAGTSSTGRGSGRSGAIASAKAAASSAVDAFLAGAGGMASDGEINGAYEKAFIAEAKSKGLDNMTINNELNRALRTDGVNYMKAQSTNREQRISEIIRKLDEGNFKSAAERDKLRAEYDRLNNERSVAATRRFNARNNIKGVWQ